MRVHENPIDRILPESFLLQQGRYVQCCAYIEKLAWLITWKLEGLDPSDDDDFQEMMSLRKHSPVDHRIERLCTVAEKQPDPLKGRILDVCRRLRDGKENRHMVIHGVSMKSKSGNGYSVEYFKNFGTRSKPDWQSYTATVRDEYIDFAVTDCGALVQEMYNISDECK